MLCWVYHDQGNVVVEKLHCLWNHKYVKNTGYSQALKEQVSSNHTYSDFGLINLKVPFNTENSLDRQLHDLPHDLLILIYFFFPFWYLLLSAIQYIYLFTFSSLCNVLWGQPYYLRSTLRITSLGDI